MSTKRATGLSAHARLHGLQHKIYRALEREAELLLGPAPRSILEYERACEQDFHGRLRQSTKEALIEEIRHHDVTLISDYHTFAQAQRTALRLMREAVRPGEAWALGIELIPSQYQRALDDFQAGRISTRKFHERIRYEEHWGFPWKNYEPLFAWARAQGVRCIALNSPGTLVERLVLGERERGARDLHSRDLWAAGIVTDRIQAQPGLRMVVLYGGHHVGRAHLPAQLTQVSQAYRGKPLTSLSIHQNHPSTYWRLAAAGRELEAQVLELKKDTYCVFSATPWAQLQSLISCAEGEDIETPDAGQTDYLSLMSAYGEVIADFFGRERRSFASLNLRTVEDADFSERPEGEPFLSPGENRLLRALVSENERFYAPRSRVAYLAAPSSNSAAEFAAIHWLHEHTRLQAFFEGGREDFFRCALQAAFGFLGSLILNPRRKCNLPQDHARRLRQLRQGAAPTFEGEAQARALVAALFSSRKAERERALESLPKTSSRQSVPTWIAARAFGKILAKNVHPVLLGLRHGSKPFNEVVSLFFKKREFEDACRMLEQLGAPARATRKNRSKSESL